MNKTKKQLEREIESANNLIRTYREEKECLSSQVTNLEGNIKELGGVVKDRERQNDSAQQFRYTIMKIIAGPSKPVSKVEAIEDLMPVDVYFLRTEFLERKRHGPCRRVDPMSFL